MTCAVCYRPARGFGYLNPRLQRGDLRRASEQRWFCSMRCQNVFSHLLEKTGGRMPDLSEVELAARHACLAPLGDYVAHLGMERPLADYSREEVQGLIDVVVRTYCDQRMAEFQRLSDKERAYFEHRLARQTPHAGVIG